MATEEFVDNTIATMKIIGMVPKNGKLCVRKGHLCLDQSDQTQCVRRWVQGDSRDTTLMHVRNTINSAFKISRFLTGLPNSTYMTYWTMDRILAEMSQCEIGLQNLKTTYVVDSMMVANLEVLLDRLIAHKVEVSKYVEKRKLHSDKFNLFSDAEAHHHNPDGDVY